MMQRSLWGLLLGCWMGLGLGSPPVLGQAVEDSLNRARGDSLAAVGDSLRQDRALAGARQAYRRSRAAYRDAGGREEAAAMRGNIGVMYYLEGDWERARRTFQQAAREAGAAGAEERRASLINNAGLAEWRLGEYDAALDHIRKAVEIHKDLGNEKRVASGRNNIANIQEERGEFQAALQNLRQALAVNRALDDSGDVAMNLNNIGLVLRSQGKYGEAEAAHREALQLHRETGDSSSVADALNNLGISLKAQGQYEDALRRYRASLQVNRSLDKQLEAATNLNNIGKIEMERERFEAARRTLQEALRINQEIDNRAGVASNLQSIGELNRRTHDAEQAQAFYEKALRIDQELGRREAVASTLYGLGQLHLAEERYGTADSVLTRAVRLTDELMETATGVDRRDYLAQEAHSFQALVTARVRAGTPSSALRAFERGRARLLAERLSEQDRSEAREIPSARELRAAVGREGAAVLYANTDTERPLTALVVTQDTIQAHEIPDSSLVQTVQSKYQDALGRLRVREDLAPASPASASPFRASKGLSRAEANGEDGLAALVRLYRHDQEVASRTQVLSDKRHRLLGKYLHELLLAPLQKDLAGHDELIVVPDGALGYLPFETLTDWNGTFLIQKRQVRYVQSLRVLRRLQERPVAPWERTEGVLAFGGGVYDANTYAADTARLSAPQTQIADQRRTADGPWPNLPWSLREATQLSQLAPSSRALTGADVREDTLRQLDKTGALRRYRALHFATHGLVVPEAPSRSALVLSGADTRRPDTTGVDGYLTMDEIAALNLDAEFVALSACQTGMGRIYRGSGVVSLAQSFLRAGADATAVSLWSVYDASTQVFMEALYRRVWNHGRSWDTALAETKRAFLSGDYGERLRDPRFWGPFVYYGRGGR
ncbi:MAG: CHAT domain-containing tetratricopeptide repeat protein [Salinibacter sp.]